ncbi:helix-turn-helix domain-containing protein [bacterium]|nr:helix-turn-helix domain-containing protein [bacterium]
MLDYDRVKLGKFLKAQRVKAGFTQGEVASRLGYSSPQFISNIERGLSVIPLKTLAVLVSQYKINQELMIKTIMDSQRQILKKYLSKAK